MKMLGKDSDWFCLSAEPLIKVKVINREIIMAADWRRPISVSVDSTWFCDSGRGLHR